MSDPTTVSRKVRKRWKLRAQVTERENREDYLRVLNGEDPDKVAYERQMKRKERGFLSWLNEIPGSGHPPLRYRGYDVVYNRRMRRCRGGEHLSQFIHLSDRHYARLFARLEKEGQ